MKALFLSLCLLNLVFLFWEFHKGALNPPIQTQTTLPTILLADEVEKARRGAEISQYLDHDVEKLQQLHADKVVETPIAMLPAAKPIQKISPKIQSVSCREIGPFANQSSAAAWVADNALRGDFFRQEILTPSAYQVYYPAASNPEQTRIQKMMLNAKGITDIWLIPSGELKGALSLGLFNDQIRAALFRNQLLQRGVQAEIKERYSSQPRVFVRIKGDQKVPKRLAAGLTSASCKKN